jgi:Asp-tRNA(Asn)/Glu-tRNA(Gln) amidotransferase A subunit family amidase
VPSEGLLPLAASFDTVGWLTRDRAVLAACARVSTHGARAVALSGRFAVAPELLAPLPPAVAAAFETYVARAVADGVLDRPEQLDLGDLAAAQEAFRVVQAFEAWQADGDWLTAHPGAVSGAVAERFLAAARITEHEVARARESVAAHRDRFERVLGDAVLLLPAAASGAPQATADPAAIDVVRAATLRLTCVAGLLGAPALSAPVLEVAGAPLGLCLVGPRDSDDALIHWAAALP